MAVFFIRKYVLAFLFFVDIKNITQRTDDNKIANRPGMNVSCRINRAFIFHKVKVKCRVAIRKYVAIFPGQANHRSGVYRQSGTNRNQKIFELKTNEILYCNNGQTVEKKYTV